MFENTIREPSGDHFGSESRDPSSDDRDEMFRTSPVVSGQQSPQLDAQRGPVGARVGQETLPIDGVEPARGLEQLGEPDPRVLAHSFPRSPSMAA